MCVASGVSITRTISNSTRVGNTSNSRRPPLVQPVEAVAAGVARFVVRTRDVPVE